MGEALGVVNQASSSADQNSDPALDLRLLLYLDMEPAFQHFTFAFQMHRTPYLTVCLKGAHPPQFVQALAGPLPVPDCGTSKYVSSAPTMLQE